MEFDLENPLTSFKEHQIDIIPLLFATESDHMPSISFMPTDSVSCLRSEAISLFSELSHNFDDFISYLALNYLDRFISKQTIPQQQGKPWIARLLVISCLSLAAKIRNTDISQAATTQRGGDFMFDAQSRHRMEMLILTGLNWRMRSITPFSFLYFFVSLFQFKQSSFSQALKDRASRILFETHYETKILDYKPSVIAASALLCASYELCEEESSGFQAAIVSCGYIDKGNLLNCLAVLKDMIMNQYDSADDMLSSSITTESNDLVSEGKSIKRRRLNSSCNDQVFFSRIRQCSSFL